MKIPGVWIHTSYPRAGPERPEECWGPTDLIGELQPSERPCPIKGGWCFWRWQHCPLTSTCMPTGTVHAPHTMFKKHVRYIGRKGICLLYRNFQVIIMLKSYMPAHISLLRARPAHLCWTFVVMFPITWHCFPTPNPGIWCLGWFLVRVLHSVTSWKRAKGKLPRNRHFHLSFLTLFCQCVGVSLAYMRYPVNIWWIDK